MEFKNNQPVPSNLLFIEEDWKVRVDYFLHHRSDIVENAEKIIESNYWERIVYKLDNLGDY